MRTRAEFGAALLLDLLGAGLLLLFSALTWQSVTAQGSFRRYVLDVDGRAVDGAVTALALAALAAVVALIATRGVARRVVGAAVAVVGVAAGWRALSASSAVSAARARSLVLEHHRGIVLTDAAPHVVVHPAWAWLSAVAAVLVVAAGAAVAVRGHRWQAMSARYEAPTEDRARTDLAMWHALERGDDPTA